MATYIVPEVPFTGGTWITNGKSNRDMEQTPELAPTPTTAKKRASRKKDKQEVVVEVTHPETPKEQEQEVTK